MASGRSSVRAPDGAHPQHALATGTKGGVGLIAKRGYRGTAATSHACKGTPKR